MGARHYAGVFTGWSTEPGYTRSMRGEAQTAMEPEVGSVGLPTSVLRAILSHLETFSDPPERSVSLHSDSQFWTLMASARRDSAESIETIGYMGGVFGTQPLRALHEKPPLG